MHRDPYDDDRDEIAAAAPQCDDPPVRIGRFFTAIPSNRLAEVTSRNGEVDVVEGPKKVWRPLSVRIFPRWVVPEGTEVTYVDELGTSKVISGPKVFEQHPEGQVQIHTQVIIPADQKALLTRANGEQKIIEGPAIHQKGPLESLEFFRVERLKETDVAFVVAATGKISLVEGKSTPVLSIDPREQLYEFALTSGGDSDGFNKQPRSLRFSILRLQPTQAYLGVVGRTSDNAEVLLKLMIYWKVGDPQKFLTSSDDPLGAMFNRIMSGLVAETQRMTFDQFKENPANMVQVLFGSEALKSYAELGIDIDRIILRGWEPKDQQVQRILNSAAALNTERDLQRAKHDMEMARLGQEQLQLQKAAENDDLRSAAASAEGSREAARLTAVFKGLQGEVGADLAPALLKLYVAGAAVKSGTLNIGSDLLR